MMRRRMTRYIEHTTTHLLDDPVDLAVNVLLAVQRRNLGHVSLSRVFEGIVPFRKNNAVAHWTADRFEDWPEALEFSDPVVYQALDDG